MLFLDLQHRPLTHSKEYIIEHLDAPNIDKNARVHKIEHESSWMDPIIKYLTDEVLPNDPIEAK